MANKKLTHAQKMERLDVARKFEPDERMELMVEKAGTGPHLRAIAHTASAAQPGALPEEQGHLGGGRTHRGVTAAGVPGLKIGKPPLASPGKPLPLIRSPTSEA